MPTTKHNNKRGPAERRSLAAFRVSMQDYISLSFL